jgi:hypothetical protein
MSFVAKLICRIPGGTGEAVGTIEETPDATPGAGELAIKTLEIHELDATNATPHRVASIHRLAVKERGIRDMIKQVKTEVAPL